MIRRPLLLVRLASPLLALASLPAAAQQLPPPACDELAALLLGSAAPAGAVCKVNLPRTDLTVSLLGAALPPGAGLTSWAAFLPEGDSSIVMGDLALTAAELPVVMQGLSLAGFSVTAVHRHMSGETPEMSFMHYMGRGDARRLAQSLRSALPSMRAPLVRSAESSIGSPGGVTGIPCARIGQEFGTGSLDSGSGFCKVTVPRNDLDITIGSLSIPASMGVASWFAFREVPDRTAVVLTGDLALEQDRVQAALDTVLAGGIDVVSLHNHMAGENPRIVFFHFQARGNALILAETMHHALDAH
jgi:Domain of Unknown Function (DUF1259)